MRSVAKWGVFRVLAATPGDFLLFFDFDCHGREIGARVRSITKGLSFGSSAFAPVIGAGFHVHDIGNSLWNDNRIGHVVLLLCSKKMVSDDKRIIHIGLVCPWGLTE